MTSASLVQLTHWCISQEQPSQFPSVSKRRGRVKIYNDITISDAFNFVRRLRYMYANAKTDEAIYREVVAFLTNHSRELDGNHPTRRIVQLGFESWKVPNLIGEQDASEFILQSFEQFEQGFLYPDQRDSKKFDIYGLNNILMEMEKCMWRWSTLVFTPNFQRRFFNDLEKIVALYHNLHPENTTILTHPKTFGTLSVTYAAYEVIEKFRALAGMRSIGLASSFLLDPTGKEWNISKMRVTRKTR